jgi:hypothetical protein
MQQIMPHIDFHFFFVPPKVHVKKDTGHKKEFENATSQFVPESTAVFECCCPFGHVLLSMIKSSGELCWFMEQSSYPWCCITADVSTEGVNQKIAVLGVF